MKYISWTKAWIHGGGNITAPWVFRSVPIPCVFLTTSRTCIISSRVFWSTSGTPTSEKSHLAHFEITMAYSSSTCSPHRQAAFLVRPFMGIPTRARLVSRPAKRSQVQSSLFVSSDLESCIIAYRCLHAQENVLWNSVWNCSLCLKLTLFSKINWPHPLLGFEPTEKHVCD